jgi:ribonucleoside-diphosphate reductase beta chain
VAIDRIIEHNKRTGFGSLCPGGLRMESFPMRLFRKGNKKFWNPDDIDFSKDAEDFAAMSDDERLSVAQLAARFMAGEGVGDAGHSAVHACHGGRGSVGG